MGAFDLPRGTVELQLKDEKGVHWENVMMTDSLYESELANLCEDWSVKHEALKARYNGREVTIPTNYHWELQFKGEKLGSFAKRAEAKAEMDKRKVQRYKDKTVKVGLPVYVKD